MQLPRNSFDRSTATLYHETEVARDHSEGSIPFRPIRRWRSGRSDALQSVSFLVFSTVN